MQRNSRDPSKMRVLVSKDGDLGLLASGDGATVAAGNTPPNAEQAPGRSDATHNQGASSDAEKLVLNNLRPRSRTDSMRTNEEEYDDDVDDDHELEDDDDDGDDVDGDADGDGDGEGEGEGDGGDEGEGDALTRATTVRTATDTCTDSLLAPNAGSNADQPSGASVALAAPDSACVSSSSSSSNSSSTRRRNDSTSSTTGMNSHVKR
jgi:hypothetical protein